MRTMNKGASFELIFGDYTKVDCKYEQEANKNDYSHMKIIKIEDCSDITAMCALSELSRK